MRCVTKGVGRHRFKQERDGPAENIADPSWVGCWTVKARGKADRFQPARMAGLCFRQSRMRPDCRPVFNVRSRSGAVRHGRLCRCTTLGPITVFRAGHHAFQHTHVGDRIGQRSGNRCPLQNRLGEGIRLERVLIADVEPDLFCFAKIAAALEPNPAGAIRRCVERDFDLDAAAFQRYSLAGKAESACRT